MDRGDWQIIYSPWGLKGLDMTQQLTFEVFFPFQFHRLMSGRMIPTILGKEWSFQELGHYVVNFDGGLDLS